MYEFVQKLVKKKKPGWDFNPGPIWLAIVAHIVASHEATDTLHRAMCLVPYLPGGMVVAIAVESITS
jgi:hypothetical protein